MTQHDERLVDRELRGRADRAQALRRALEQRGGNGAELDPDAEKDLWQSRTSWKHFADLILVAIAWTVIAVIVSFTMPPTAARAVFVMTMLGWLYVAGRIAHGILNCRYRLTTQRLFVERGILSRTIDQAELIRVDDVRIHKTLLNRFTGLGSIEIFSTDSSDRRVVIVGVDKPEYIADSIRERMRRLRQTSLFVESL